MEELKIMAANKKVCKKCKILKAFSEFSKDKYSVDGYNSICVSCHRNYNLKKKLINSELLEKKDNYPMNFKEESLLLAGDFSEISSSLNGMFRVFKYEGDNFNEDELINNVILFLQSLKGNQSFALDFEAEGNFINSKGKPFNASLRKKYTSLVPIGEV
jgi:hypothetical protein